MTGTKTIKAIAIIALGLATQLIEANPKLAFWDEQRKGANGGAEDGSPEWFEAAPHDRNRVHPFESYQHEAG